MKKIKVYMDFDTEQNTRLKDQMCFKNGKNGRPYVAECVEIYHHKPNGKWYYVYEKC